MTSASRSTNRSRKAPRSFGSSSRRGKKETRLYSSRLSCVTASGLGPVRLDETPPLLIRHPRHLGVHHLSVRSRFGHHLLHRLLVRVSLDRHRHRVVSLVTGHSVSHPPHLPSNRVQGSVAGIIRGLVW